jgi:hypothetical protein
MDKVPYRFRSIKYKSHVKAILHSDRHPSKILSGFMTGADDKRWDSLIRASVNENELFGVHHALLHLSKVGAERWLNDEQRSDSNQEELHSATR